MARSLYPTRTSRLGADRHLFEAVRIAALNLPDVTATTKYDGSPVLKRGGAFMAGRAMHPSAEEDSLVVRVDPETRQSFLDEAPETYYVTDYYSRHPVVLARLRQLDAHALRDLLMMSWRLTETKVRRA